MIDIILLLIIICILAMIVLYLYKAKSRGEKCIGCPYAKECMKRRNNESCHK